jgi:pyridoxine 5-phosphate synthase
MCRLSVNINKIATLRNARGGTTPSVLHFAKALVDLGVRGITVHPRPDGRHIRYDDVRELSRFIEDHNATAANEPVEFNVEGYPDSDFLTLIGRLNALHQITLVPDPPEALTSNAGWNLVEHEKKLHSVLKAIRNTTDARVSVFVDAMTWTTGHTEALRRLKPQRIELYTEPFAKAFAQADEPTLQSTLGFFSNVAKTAHALGIGVNAGHDLDHKNLRTFLESVPHVEEVSIGHALISQCLYWGLEKTLVAYRQAIQGKSVTP